MELYYEALKLEINEENRREILTLFKTSHELSDMKLRRGGFALDVPNAIIIIQMCSNLGSTTYSND